MVADEKPEPQKDKPDAPRGPEARSEGALGLEVARLFGMDPRLLVARRVPPAKRPTAEDEEESS